MFHYFDMDYYNMDWLQLYLFDRLYHYNQQHKHKQNQMMLNSMSHHLDKDSFDIDFEEIMYYQHKDCQNIELSLNQIQ